MYSTGGPLVFNDGDEPGHAALLFATANFGMPLFLSVHCLVPSLFTYPFSCAPSDFICSDLIVFDLMRWSSSLWL